MPMCTVWSKGLGFACEYECSSCTDYHWLCPQEQQRGARSSLCVWNPLLTGLPSAKSGSSTLVTGFSLKSRFFFQQANSPKRQKVKSARPGCFLLFVMPPSPKAATLVRKRTPPYRARNLLVQCVTCSAVTGGGGSRVGATQEEPGPAATCRDSGMCHHCGLCPTVDAGWPPSPRGVARYLSSSSGRIINNERTSRCRRPPTPTPTPARLSPLPAALTVTDLTYLA